MENHSVAHKLVVPFKPETSARARLDYWVTVELCLPGKLQLVPVLEAHGDIVDFICAASSPPAARLLNAPSGEPVGRRLSQLLARHRFAGDLLAAYIAVARTGETCCCESVSALGDCVHHHVSRPGRNVVQAELRDRSAIERAKAAFVVLKSVQVGPTGRPQES